MVSIFVAACAVLCIISCIFADNIDKKDKTYNNLIYKHITII